MFTASDNSFNDQTFPITLCIKNSIENNADMAIALDSSSKTDDLAVEEEFPFIIDVQNLGPKAASGVIINVSLPNNISFVEDQSNKYVCDEPTPSSELLRCIANGDVPTGQLGLTIVLQGTSDGSNNVAVSVEATSADPNSANNSFNQTINIGESEEPCTVVSIPDAILKAAIRSALNIPSDPICETDMLLLTSLSEPDGGISSFEGLQHATNLLDLSLPRNFTQYVSLKPLTGLIKLTHLNLSQTTVPDITPLTGLVNLQVLDLTESYFLSDNYDLTPLAGLVDLKELELYNTRVSNLTPLAELTNLELLNLQENHISDITPLAGLTNLKRLNLSFSFEHFSDLMPLEQLINLEYLNLEVNGPFDDITPLSGLVNLKELLLGQSKITDITALVSNTGLGTGDTIDLWNNCLDISGSPDLTDIETLEGRGVSVDYGQQGVSCP